MNVNQPAALNKHIMTSAWEELEVDWLTTKLADKLKASTAKKHLGPVGFESQQHCKNHVRKEWAFRSN